MQRWILITSLVLVLAVTTVAVTKWALPDAGAKWKPYIDTAQLRWKLPAQLLGRLLYEESRFRDDIITGQTVSRTGALGIAQFMPATARDYGINPLDPVASIDAAGHYLRDLFNRFGDWKKAIAAYNWGQGNVAAHGIEHLPDETAQYLAAIAGDVGLA